LLKNVKEMFNHLHKEKYMSSLKPQPYHAN